MRLRVRAARALAVALLALACGRAPAAKPAAELDTVDVTAKPDAAASLATDTVARAVGTAGAVAGALPADFPRDVPLPQPSSLIDFGPRSVTFEVEGTPAAALDAYSGRLRAAGFRAEPGGRWRRGSRRLAVAARPAAGGSSHLVLEILPGG
jgi:catechol 2,3-dioxygenase-like lactoylglutathione lyase family enzyme